MIFLFFSLPQAFPVIYNLLYMDIMDFYTIFRTGISFFSTLTKLPKPA